MCLLGEASRGRLRVLLIHLDAVSSVFISENLSIEIQLFSWRFDRHSFCLLFLSFLFCVNACLARFFKPYCFICQSMAGRSKC